MVTNANLTRANRAKNDEFYTRLTDIEKELKHYRGHFKDKVVLCNCDDPYESNFFKYFVLNFNRLGLKQVIATCYSGSPIAHKEWNLSGKPYKAVINTVYDATGDGGIDLEDVQTLFETGENTLEELEGDGDFRSPECLTLLEEADIVVTNPPFSLFREYVATLVEYDKKFLVIGNMNAVTYKEVFPLLKNNLIWTGYKSFGGGMNMIYPKEQFDSSKVKKYYVDDRGNYIVNIMGCIWFTNLDIKKRHEDLILVKKYNPELYPTYDNYDAIDVSRVKDIPYDWDGIMGVPITFLDKYNPDQFEIMGATESEGKGFSNGLWKESSGVSQPLINGKRKYKRIFIRHKHPEMRSKL